MRLMEIELPSSWILMKTRSTRVRWRTLMMIMPNPRFFGFTVNFSYSKYRKMSIFEAILLIQGDLDLLSNIYGLDIMIMFFIPIRGWVVAYLLGLKTQFFYLQTVKDIENDLDAQSQDCYIAVEALCEVCGIFQFLKSHNKINKILFYWWINKPNNCFCRFCVENSLLLSIFLTVHIGYINQFPSQTEMSFFIRLRRCLTSYLAL